MSIENTQQSVSRSCVSCTIFFGSQTTNWMCSSCFKQKTNQVKRKESTITNISEKQEILTVQIQQHKKQVPSIDKSRCFKCNKKVGLLGVQCKCKMTFCNHHRMPESHECDIDYRKLGKDKLTKDHQIVASSKITEI